MARQLREKLMCPGVTLTCAFIGRTVLHRPATTSEKTEIGGFMMSGRFVLGSLLPRRAGFLSRITAIEVLSIMLSSGAAVFGPGSARASRAHFGALAEIPLSSWE